MELSEYRAMHDAESNYWWHIGRRKVLQTIAHRFFTRAANILDVGCGTGINYEWLQDLGTVTGLDDHDVALEYCRSHQAYDHLILGDATKVQGQQVFDAITAFDVLEHIEGDSEALASWYQTLKPNGLVFISVPAYQWLWSGHDVALHHFRRYTASELRTKFEKAGFKIKLITPFFFFTLPILALVRFAKKNQEGTTYVDTPAWASKILIALSGIEAWWISKGVGLPWGSSIAVIAQK